MTSIQVEKAFYIILYSLLVASCLQLCAVTWAKPLPATEEAAVNETDCNCNSTNLTMMVDGDFLHKWLKFNAHHNIRHLSEAAGNLAADTNDLQDNSVIWMIWMMLRLLWITVVQTWMTLRLLWMTVKQMWMILRLLWMRVEQTWMILRLLWMRVEQIWMILRLLWMRMEQTWKTLRRLWMRVELTWMTLKLLWITAEQTWMKLRLLWMTVEQTWMKLRLLWMMVNQMLMVGQH